MKIKPPNTFRLDAAVGNKSSMRRRAFAQARSRRRRIRAGGEAAPPAAVGTAVASPSARQGFDPELLFVECSRCGAPILWEPGRATQLLDKAGIDPLELDSSCMLITDACPSCSRQKEYTVKILRVSGGAGADFPPVMGHA